jgi:hypothetical protein
MIIMRIVFCLALLFFYNALAHSTNKIEARFSILGSSEPVAIDDMVNGWDGDYQQGELAFANATWDISFTKTLELDDEKSGSIRVARGYRIYYFLKFNKETANFYRAQEQKIALKSNKKIDLEVKHFEAPSLSFSYESPQMNLSFYDLKSSFNVTTNFYQPGHFQFGEIKGTAFGPGTDSFSANIDYRYDQFKLPFLEEEKGFDTEKGQGYSLDLSVILEQENWVFDLGMRDIFARFSWGASGNTVACLQTDTGDGAVCESNGGSGRSEVKSVSETIPVSITGALKHKGYDLSLHAFQHDTYQRLGIEKGLKTALGRLGFFLYYPRLAGLSWQTSIFNVQLGADTLKLSKARNVQFNMGVNWRW